MTSSIQDARPSTRRAAPGAARPHARPVGPGAGPITARTLVVEDDRTRQWLLTDAVLRTGDEAALADSGARALEILQDDEVDVPAVLVGGLPDGTRRGFVSWARPRFPELAIVALADDVGEATALYNAGADIVTTPPIDPDLLGAKLAAARRRTRTPGGLP